MPLTQPKWLEPLFPWEQRRVTVNGRSMAYIDEGDRNGQPVLLLSGNPTPGFLYRDYRYGVAEGVEFRVHERCEPRSTFR